MRGLLVQAAGEVLLPETPPEAERLLAEAVLDTLTELVVAGGGDGLEEDD